MASTAWVIKSNRDIAGFQWMIAEHSFRVCGCRITRLQCLQKGKEISCYYFANEIKPPRRSSVPYALRADLIAALRKGDVIWNVVELE